MTVRMRPDAKIDVTLTPREEDATAGLSAASDSAAAGTAATSCSVRSDTVAVTWRDAVNASEMRDVFTPSSRARDCRYAASSRGPAPSESVVTNCTCRSMTEPG